MAVLILSWDEVGRQAGFQVKAQALQQKLPGSPYQLCHFSVEIATETEIVGFFKLGAQQEQKEKKKRKKADRKRDQRKQENVIPGESYALSPFKSLCLFTRTSLDGEGGKKLKTFFPV